MVVISAAIHSTQLRPRGTALNHRKEPMALLPRLLELMCVLQITKKIKKAALRMRKCKLITKKKLLICCILNCYCITMQIILFMYTL